MFVTPLCEDFTEAVFEWDQNAPECRSGLFLDDQNAR